jgi:N-acetylglucosamine kinase-like BadF-type ATPase
MSDGRLPRGALHAAFRESLGLSDDLDICGKVLNAHTRGSIAALSELVARAAQDGDASAIRVLDDAARELAAVIDAVRQALEFEPGEDVPLSYSGGVFNAGTLILDPFKRHLKARSACYRLQAPIASPGAGAAIHAARLAGQPLSIPAVRRLGSLPHGEIKQTS